MKLMFLLFALFTARAIELTQPQLENDIRQALKDITSLEQVHFADHAQFIQNLEKLNYKMPKSLAGYVSVTVSAEASSFQVTMVGLKSPIQDKTYRTDQSGIISGLEQFADAHEQEAEIKRLLAAAAASLDAYFTEWGENSTNPEKIGLVIPEALKKIGQLEIILEGTGYHVDFKVNSGPLQTKIFSQSGNGKVQELAAIQNKQNEELKTIKDNEAKEIHASAGRDFMPGTDESRGGPAGSDLVVSITTTNPSIEIKDIKVSMGRRSWSSRKKEDRGESVVFRNGPDWPCSAALTVEVNYFDKKASRRSRKKIPVVLSCTY